jgi:hypothetical protein
MDGPAAPLAIMRAALNGTISGACHLIAQPTFSHPLTPANKHVHVTPSDPRFVWYILTAITLVLLGGIFSGLTLGLMGLDTVGYSA